MNHYQHSGRAPISGVILSLLQCGAAAALAGILYTFIAHYVLFLIVLMALPAALGLCLVPLVGHAAKTYKIRNVLAVRILAFATAVVALYAAWGTTIYGMVAWEELPRTFLDLQWRPYLPSSILGVAQHLFAKGFFIVNEGDEPLHGWLLATIWVAEAAIIIGLPLFFAERMIAREVFCERCDAWIRPTIINRLFASGDEPAWQRVAVGELEALNELPRTEPGVRPVVELSLHRCPTCAEAHYLTVTAVRAGPNGTQEEKVIIDRLEIPADAVELAANGGYEPTNDDEYDEEEESDDADLDDNEES